MAISVNWATRVISVPRNDLTVVQLVPTEVRELDLNTFRLELKALEDDEGMPYPDTHRHNTEVNISGLTLARVIEIINNYTITFEDGQYAVNLIGANSNIGDRTNVNQVSVRSFNSAGAVVVESASALSAEQQIQLDKIQDKVCADEEHMPTEILYKREGTEELIGRKNVVGSNLKQPITFKADPVP